MANIKDVAKKAGVSAATVSRVINGDPVVRPETAEHVRRVMAELAYEPNVLGRDLRTQKTGTVLTLIPTASNQFYSKILHGIEDTLRQAGIRSLFAATHDSQETEESFLTMLCQKRADGVILLQSAFTMEQLQKKLGKIPAVFCCEYPEDAPFSTVGIDNIRAACEATSVLLEKAGDRVGMIGFSDYVSSGEARQEGYHKAMKKAHATPGVVLTPVGKHTFEGAQEAYLQFVERFGVPDGLFCASDLLAAGVMKQAALLGHSPKIIGFDDTAITRMLTPTLSSVSQPRYELGMQAAKLLLERMEQGSKPPRHVILDHKLVLRQSCEA